MKQQKFNINQIDSIAQEISFVISQKNLVVFFIGQTGAGKTTLIKHILKNLGLDPMQVKSPTFALKRTYKIQEQTIHHLDLHRLEKQSLQDLELHDQATYLIEWGNIASQTLKPDLVIRLDYTEDPNQRQITTESL